MHRKFESCLGNTREITAQVHTEIVEVLRSRDEEASAVLLAEHVQVWGRHQLDLFKDSET
jgi:DNA-binding GntR family transcriptional regulator